MERILPLEMVRVTEAAALAAAELMGRGDEDAADAAAVEAMRRKFNDINISGRVVIGEGERDEAPMLYIGEEVGKALPGSSEVDIAVDPLEGTKLTARGDNGALAVMAIGGRNTLLHAPDTYMMKLAVGQECAGLVDLEDSITDNLKRFAEAKKMAVSDLTVCMLDRPRHNKFMAECRALGTRIRFIEDGDVSGALATCRRDSPVDVLMGIGGAPEGVLAACALRAMGGDMQARLQFRNEHEISRARKMGMKDPHAILTLLDLAGGDDVLFAATGVTDGDFLKGVRYQARGATTESVVMRSATGTLRWIRTEHDFSPRDNHTAS
jgi:fructose-1,6-bisphosphatase II